MRKEEYEKAFTEKIESFKNEPEYEILLQLSEKLLKRQTDQKQALETRSLMDRIIVMPKRSEILLSGISWRLTVKIMACQQWKNLQRFTMWKRF